MRLLTYNDFQVKANLRDMVQPFPAPSLLTPISIDLTLGEEALNLTTGEKVSIDEDNPLRVRHGDFVNVWSHETLHMPDKRFGMVFSKVSLVSQGLTHFGTKVDPGFNDKLQLSFKNDGNAIIELKKGQPICSVAFFELDEDPGKSYKARPGITVAMLEPPISFTYQLTAEDIEKFERYYSREIMNLYEAFVRRSEEQHKRIEEARQDISSMTKDFRTAFYAALGAIALAALLSVIVLIITLVS